MSSNSPRFERFGWGIRLVPDSSVATDAVALAYEPGPELVLGADGVNATLERAQQALIDDVQTVARDRVEKAFSMWGGSGGAEAAYTTLTGKLLAHGSTGETLSDEERQTYAHLGRLRELRGRIETHLDSIVSAVRATSDVDQVEAVRRGLLDGWPTLTTTGEG